MFSDTEVDILLELHKIEKMKCYECSNKSTNNFSGYISFIVFLVNKQKRKRTFVITSVDVFKSFLLVTIMKDVSFRPYISLQLDTKNTNFGHLMSMILNTKLKI